ncbi:ABC-2 type transporter-domain-containing protein [Lipomyces chichibuensis]|uniref:ABC-2 type transporter-domain-containing protein n=1 Tax=Lipomyces chichibuensis TaxID=1546026 RepID=UPI0033431DB0
MASIDLENQLDEDLTAVAVENLHMVNLNQLENLVRTLSTRSAAHASDDLSESDFKLENVLRRRVRMHEEDGIKSRSFGVMFKGLTVKGIDMSTTSLLTIGEILMSPFRMRETFRDNRSRTLRNLIQDFTGVVHKGEMLLVLGRPGAGCSTFLRTIAGETESYKGVEGVISYDGIDQQTMKARFKGDVLYSSETDEHFPTLNVNETLSFAADVKAPVIRAGNVSRKEYVEDLRDVLATVFGLRHTYHTPVGNDFVRGVSGGERKRVSLAEVMAGRANLVSWDNSTRGLDASTALEYTQTLRTSTNLLKNTAIVAIYQAGENIYNLFDKVTVIYAGRQVYFGPATMAKAYFERMGYVCPSRQSTAEFLTAVTDPAGRFARSGYENRVPTTADEFVAYWKSSPEYKEMVAEIEEYERAINPPDTLKHLNESANQERPKLARRKNSPYTLSFWAQLRVLVRRGFQRQKGDKAYLITSVFASVVQSLIIGSLFYNVPGDFQGSFSRGGVLFFSLLFFTLNAVAEMSMLYPQRKVVDKQKRFAFYHPAAEAIAYIVTSMPIKMLAMTIFGLVLYFMSNLNRKAGQFFIFLLFMQFVAFTMTACFQMVSSFTKTVEIANSVAGLVLLIVFIYAGYLIPRPLMHPWFKWLSYLNPIAYGFEGLMGNEFHGRDLDCTAALIPQGPGFADVPLEYKVCAATGSTPGTNFILGDNYITDAYEYKWTHVWRNFGILIALATFFVVMYAIGTETTSLSGTQGDVLIFRRGHVPENPEDLQSDASPDQTMAAVVDEKGESGDSSASSTTDKAMEEVIGKVPSRINTALRMNEVFSWQHVNYTITLKDGEERQLLCDVQGYTKPGTLTALMGESGAGKTTLLNTLAQRINVGVITGDMFVDGKPLNAGFKRRTGYVQQQDLHVPESTVREALQFAALLRQPKSVPIEEKYEYVETVIEMLGMQSYAEAIVGIPGQGLNVEQRKKLSIGVELASKPSLLLFLDEPTSGLDSQSAWAVVQLLRRLANAGQSILCTIHQPSATLFEQFDKLLLLKKGGQTVYFGDIGRNSQKLIDYFEGQGAPKCGEMENPAEYILNCIGAGATAAADRNWYDVWINSPNFRQVTAEIEELHADLSVLPPQHVSKDFTDKFAVSWFTQASAVVIRTYRQYWRSPTYIIAKVVLYIAAGLFTGFSFWKSEFTIAGVSNLLFGVFLSIVIGFPLINQMQPRVINIRELFEVRESASNTYHWSALILSLILAEIPYNVLFASVYYCCYYFPIGYMRTAERAGYYYLVYCILYTSFWTTFGLAVTTFVPDAATANIVTSLLLSMVLSFSGIFQPASLIPHFWKFMYRISPITYFLQSLLGNVVHDGKVHCKPSEFSVFTPPPGYSCYEYAGSFAETAGGYLNNPNATSNCEYCKWTVADQYLSQVSIDYSGQRWRNVGFECAYILFNIAFCFFGFYAFRVATWKLPKFGKKQKETKVVQTNAPAEA